MGQPGIGKTYFLFYALVCLLQRKQPVVMQLLSGEPFYLFFRDIVTLHHLFDVSPLDSVPTRTWALCDSNDNIRIPAAVFRAIKPKVRVIQATSPKASRWKRWTKQSDVDCYVMDIWTTDEIRQLGMLLKEPYVERMVNLATLWGGIPQTVIDNLHQPDSIIEDGYHWAARFAIKHCSEMILCGMGLNFPDTASPFYVVRPKRNPKTNEILHTFHMVCVPTDTLLTVLAKSLQEENKKIKLQFYDDWRILSETRRAANHIYTSWFHGFMAAQGVLQCNWCSLDGTALPFQLGGVDRIVDTAQSQGTATPPCYWVTSREVPGVNGALMYDSQIVAFQSTISWYQNNHTPPNEGLRSLRRQLPNHLRNLPWRMMFVGPQEEGIKYIASRYHGRIDLGNGCKVTVGWSVMDPLQAGVEAVWSEFDPMLDEDDEW